MIKDIISFPDFAKLDLRVGRVVEAENIEGSKNLLRMKIDMGSDDGIRTIFAGIKRWYKPSQLKGKKFIFVANLEPKMMPSFAKATAGKGEESNGMMLAADVDGKCNLISVNKKIPEGTVIR